MFRSSNTSPQLSYFDFLKVELPRLISSSIILPLIVLLIIGILDINQVLSVHERGIPYQIVQINSTYHQTILDFSINHKYVANDTVPYDIAIGIVILIPVGILTILQSFGKIRINHDIKAFASSYLVSFAGALTVTWFIKSYVGRLRPHFYDRCKFDVATLKCTASAAETDEARKSFPSGHSSTAFCTLWVTTLFLLGKQQLVKNQILKLTPNTAIQSILFRTYIFFCLCPAFVALFIAVSRVHDNHHFPSDIIGGSLIGIIISQFSYQLFYPPIFTPFSSHPLEEIELRNKEELELLSPGEQQAKSHFNIGV